MIDKNNLSVLHVTTSFPRFKNDFAGGFVYRFAKYLAEDGVRVTVVCPGDKGAEDCSVFDGLVVKRANYFYPRRFQMLCYEGGGIFSNLKNSWLARIQLPFFFLAMVLKVMREYRQHDLIHCHWLPTVWVVELASVFFRQKKKIVFTNWGSDTRLLPKWLVRWSLSFVDICVSTAEETHEHLRQAGITHFKKIMTPIDEDRFDRAHVDETVFRREFDTQAPIISFIGRLNYFKDPVTFIKAMSILRDQGVDFIAVIAGDGDLRESCENLVKENDLSERVHLLGNREDIEFILAASAVTVHISPIENTWANVIAEAMFIGCPVIMTDVGHTKSTFNDGVDCLMVPPKNPQALAAKMCDILCEAISRDQLVSGAKKLLENQKKRKHLIVNDLVSCYRGLVSS